MADPVTVVGLVGASLSITVRAAKIGKYLYSLKSKFQKAEASVQQVSTHVSAIRVAARALSAWMEDDAIDEEKMEEVKDELLQVLIACDELLTDLEGYVVKALAGADKMRFGGRVSYLWNEKVVKETSQTLHQQETALILILNVLNKARKSEQREQLQEPQNREVLAAAKKPSSSIFGLKDGQSQSVKYSVLSENSENLDMVFSFDLYLMASPVYRKWMTSMTRQRVHQGKASRQDPKENEEVSSIVSNEEFAAATVMNDQWEIEDDTDTPRTIQDYSKASEMGPLWTEPKGAVSRVATNEPLKPSDHQRQIPRWISESRWDEIMTNAAETAGSEASPIDRWAQIRKNAAERAAKGNRESPSVAYGDNSEEDTIQARVERIKRRVAELTGNLPDSSLKQPVNRGTVPPQLTTPATS